MDTRPSTSTTTSTSASMAATSTSSVCEQTGGDADASKRLLRRKPSILRAPRDFEAADERRDAGGGAERRHVQFAAGTKEDEGTHALGTGGRSFPARARGGRRASGKRGGRTQKAPNVYANNNNSNGTRDDLSDHFYNAIKLAQQRVADDGIVHLTEFYEADNDTEPTRVEGLPGVGISASSTHIINQDVDFGEDSEEFLDMTRGGGGSSGGGKRTDAPTVVVNGGGVQDLADEADNPVGNQNEEEEEEVPEVNVHGKEENRSEDTYASEEDDDDRELMLSDLLAAEREFEEEERRQEERAAKQREKGFGSGFARGFFGSATEKKKKQEQEQVPVQVPVPVPVVSEKSKTPVAAAQTENAVVGRTDDAVQERVVERKRAPRKRRARAKARRRVVVDLLETPEDEQDKLDRMMMMNDGIVPPNDADADADEPAEVKSKFKQMREKGTGVGAAAA